MMLHSNTDAGSFKLQPAPRPKSKKRPQNPPALPAAPAAKADIVTHPNLKAPTQKLDSDTGLLRSCFEDDEDALTPKASLFNVALLTDKERVASSGMSEASVGKPRRSRASTTSFASIASGQSSSSVTRLLAAMSLSTSPRRSTSVVQRQSQSQSPSATLTVMLTNKSPTPSSPLFPRRTLMRSLSSTCLNNSHSNATVKSPTSPVVRSPGASLRKRMGWRGALSARMHEDTAIIMSPGSPLTPRRAEALHTPTQASIASVLDPAHLPPYDQAEDHVEPLSATLKALGAKRRTERFASTCIPVQSPLDESADGFDVLRDVKRPLSEVQLTGNQETFQLMTATRKIFHLPTWVRFEANHHARSRVVQENREAAAEFSQLQIASLRDSAKAQPGQAVVKQDRGEALPKTSHLGDVAPDSPNGELFAGFDIDGPPPVSHSGDDGEEVVSVVRRPTMAALRDAQGTTAKNGARVMGVLRSALPPFRPQHRIKGSHPARKLNLLSSHTAANATAAADEKDRRDGWGGILTRYSWFPGHAKGPLVSPASSAAPKGVRGLKLMLLQSSRAPLVPKAGKPNHEIGDDEWEDIVDAPAANAVGAEQSFLELEDAPRFFSHRTSAPVAGSWFPFLRLAAPRPKPSKDGYADTLELSMWHTRPLPSSDTLVGDEVVASELITKGSRSVENRPHKKHGRRSSGSLPLRTKIGLVVVTVALLGAVVANIVILSRSSAAPRTQDQHPGAPKGVVGGLGVGYVPTPTTAPTEPDAHESSVAKAAQLSQPWL